MLTSSKVFNDIPTHSMPPPANFVIADLNTEADKRAFLNSMTKPKIKEWLREQFRVGIKNFDRTAKHEVVEHIVKTWNDLMAKQVQLMKHCKE